MVSGDRVAVLDRVLCEGFSDDAWRGLWSGRDIGAVRDWLQSRINKTMPDGVASFGLIDASSGNVRAIAYGEVALVVIDELGASSGIAGATPDSIVEMRSPAGLRLSAPGDRGEPFDPRGDVIESGVVSASEITMSWLAAHAGDGGGVEAIAPAKAESAAMPAEPLTPMAVEARDFEPSRPARVLISSVPLAGSVAAPEPPAPSGGATPMISSAPIAETSQPKASTEPAPAPAPVPAHLGDVAPPISDTPEIPEHTVLSGKWSGVESGAPAPAPAPASASVPPDFSAQLSPTTDAAPQAAHAPQQPSAPFVSDESIVENTIVSLASASGGTDANAGSGADAVLGLGNASDPGADPDPDPDPEVDPESAATAPAAPASESPLIAVMDHDGNTILSPDLAALRSTPLGADVSDDPNAFQPSADRSDVSKPVASEPDFAAVQQPVVLQDMGQGFVVPQPTLPSETAAPQQVPEPAPAEESPFASRPNPSLPSPLPPVSIGQIVVSTGDVYELDRTVIVGRRPRVDRVVGAELPLLVSVPSPNRDISRNHVEFRIDRGRVLIVDVGATNGSAIYRSGQPPHRLGLNEAIVAYDGDVVSLGEGITIHLVLQQR